MKLSRSVSAFKCSRGQIYGNETLLTGAGCECARIKYVLNNFRQVELLPAAANRYLCYECVSANSEFSDFWRAWFYMREALGMTVYYCNMQPRMFLNVAKTKTIDNATSGFFTCSMDLFKLCSHNSYAPVNAISIFYSVTKASRICYCSNCSSKAYMWYIHKVPL